ncbi:glycogenin glucosyltransferase glg1 [Saguinus oedipus]|uniref:Golgi apparatus protein 1 n=1 Tax=Saguinus oedipus TaxID=9490 RepID=A0ABQ9TL09_SAGOE|nr:glycogenin glucosyltransferase glg1 [Saguinus oedipus]
MEALKLLWNYKLNLTTDPKFESVAREVCKSTITEVSCERILEVANGLEEKIISVDQTSPYENDSIKECADEPVGKGYMVSCLVDHRGNITEYQCHQYITKMTAIIFSDYRLICGFMDDCKNDINILKCGSIRLGEKDAHSQGEVVSCLEKGLVKEAEEREPKIQVSELCKKAILRVAELSSDDFHLDRHLYFACRDDRERFCENTQAGEGRVYKCLFNHKFEESMSEKCREALTTRQKLIAQDYKVSYSLAKSCKSDLKKYRCNVENLPRSREARLSYLLMCLESAVHRGRQVSSECQGEMLDYRRMLMEDFSLSPEIILSCRGEIEHHCSGLHRKGRTLHCLMKVVRGEKGNLGMNCQQALQTLIQETDPGADYRIDRALNEACESVIQTACKHIRSGDPMLDPVLYRKCQGDASRLCHTHGWNETSELMPPGAVFSCLYRHAYRTEEQGRRLNTFALSAHELVGAETSIPQSPGICLPQLLPFVGMFVWEHRLLPQLSRECRAEVQRILHQRAMDVKLDPALQDKCLIDLGKWCSEKTETGQELRFPGSICTTTKPLLEVKCEKVTHTGLGRFKRRNVVAHSGLLNIGELECLQDHLDDLVVECRDIVGNLTELESEQSGVYRSLKEGVLTGASATWVFLLKGIISLCSAETVDVADNQIDSGDLMECLIQNKHQKDMNEKCAIGVTHFQLVQMKDFRFSYKFKMACKEDVLKLCPNIKKKVDVVICLSTTVRNDTLQEAKEHRVSLKCRRQLRVEELEMIIECLKENKKQLSTRCHQKVFKLQETEMMDPELDYTLMRVCKQMIKRFCPEADSKTMLQCLKQNKNSELMDPKCKQMITKRQITQNTDYRLNPMLRKACKADIPKFCHGILTKAKDDSELEGQVISCLKLRYADQRLSSDCEDQIRIIIQESALDYRLDPQLQLHCSDEISSLCAEEAAAQEQTGQVEECLKVNLLKIKTELCKKEVLNMLKESKADIFVDPVLHTACALDIKHHCAAITPGRGRQMSCLMEALEDKRVRLQPECKKRLNDRIEMWSYAAKVAPADGFSDLAMQVMTSPSKNYILSVISGSICILFLIGLMCGRITKRVTRELKDR